MGQQIDLIVGLGNPAPEYLTTRHNAGFWFADRLAAQHGTAFAREKKLHAERADLEIAGQRIRLLKPQTWMNDSGRAVSAAIHYYRIPAGHVLVAYDELDLPPGRAKLKFGGGDAGHRGIRSVIGHIGPGFWRLRLGVGHPGPGRREDVLGHVLRRAARDEEQLIIDSIAAALGVLPVLIESGAQIASNRLHAPRPEPHGETEADGPAAPAQSRSEPSAPRRPRPTSGQAAPAQSRPGSPRGEAQRTGKAAGDDGSAD